MFIVKGFYTCQRCGEEAKTDISLFESFMITFGYRVVAPDYCVACETTRAEFANYIKDR